MTEQLEIRDVDVVHPRTGEVLSVRHASTDQLARFLDEIRDFESRLREAKSLVNREALRRMDLDGQWTCRVDGFTLSAPSPAPGEEFDGEALAMDLADLADAGHISDEAVARAVKIETTYKVQSAGVRALRKLGGVVKDTIDKHASEVERRRYVKVERSS